MDSVLYHKNFLYIPEIICFKIISHHYDDPFADYFKIKKNQIISHQEVLLTDPILSYVGLYK